MEKDIIGKTADFFKLFSDQSRLHILYSLLNKELKVNDIAEIIGMSQSATSHHLKKLFDNRLVKKKRHGQTVLYSLNDDHVALIIKQGIEHVQE